MKIDTSAETRRFSAEEIEEWLVKYIENTLEIPRASIDVNAGLTDLGIDSVSGIGIMGDLLDWTGLQIDPTLFYEASSIRRLSEELSNI